MRRRDTGTNILSHPSFLDLWANTVGALIFIIFITFLALSMFALVHGLKVNWWPLRINTETLPQATVKHDYQVVLAATGGNELPIEISGVKYGTYKWTLIKGELPPGLRLDPQKGIIYGTPRKASEAELIFSVDDAPVLDDQGHVIMDRKPVKKAFRLKVVAPPPPPPPLTIKTREVPRAVCGMRYALQLAAIGGSPPYHWSCASLPQGLSCSREGEITGVPETEGRYELAVSARDKGNEKAERSLILEVMPRGKVPYHKLRIVTSRLPVCRVDEECYIRFAAEGGVTPYDWSIEPAAALEEMGLKFSSSGEVTGRPARQGRIDLTVRVKCQWYGKTDADEKRLSLSIKPKASPYRPLEFLWER